MLPQSHCLFACLTKTKHKNARGQPETCSHVIHTGLAKTSALAQKETAPSCTRICGEKYISLAMSLNPVSPSKDTQNGITSAGG
jgi:hypothetical protein